MSRPRRIAVDFDGTASYFHEPWRGVEHTGDPIPKMVAKIKAWLAAGDEVSIYTARITCQGDHSHEDPVRAVEVVKAWCLENIGVVLPVTNIKLGFDLFYDDRAVHVMKNTGVTLQEHVIEMLTSSMEQADVDQETYAKTTLRQLREYFQALPPC